MKRKFNTIDVANLAIIHYKDEIHEIWKNNNSHDAFVKFREIAKKAIIKNYGKRVLNELSGQFIGYSAHYIYVHCRAYLQK